MACKKEPPGAKPFLAGLLKLSVTYQNVNTPSLTAANVLHAIWNDGINHPVGDLASLATSFKSIWTSRIIPWIGPSINATSWTVQSLGGDGLISAVTGTVNGSHAGHSLPPNVAVCVSWRSTIVQRGGRPRTYIPGPPDAALTSLDNPTLLSTYSGGLATAASNMVNDFTALSIGGHFVNLGVPSYYSKCNLRPVPQFFSFGSAVVHDRLDSQRRRLGKERLYAID